MRILEPLLLLNVETAARACELRLHQLMALILVLHGRMRVQRHALSGLLLLRIQYLHAVCQFAGSVMLKLLGCALRVRTANILTLVQLLCEIIPGSIEIILGH